MSRRTEGYCAHEWHGVYAEECQPGIALPRSFSCRFPKVFRWIVKNRVAGSNSHEFGRSGIQYEFARIRRNHLQTVTMT